MTDEAPRPPTDWDDEEPWLDDSLASFESERDPWDAQILEQEKRNKLNFTRAMGWIAVCSLYLLWAVAIVSAFIWLWHFITPWPFLTTHQIDRLQSVVFSGLAGAVASSWAKRYAGKP